MFTYLLIHLSIYETCKETRDAEETDEAPDIQIPGNQMYTIEAYS